MFAKLSAIFFSIYFFGGKEIDIFFLCRMTRDWDPDCKVFIGGLRDDANKYDLEDAFSKYGPVRNVWVARRPPGFAFVEMEDPRDAEDAVRGIDGTRVCGSRGKWR